MTGTVIANQQILTGVISSSGSLSGTISSSGVLTGSVSIPEDFVDYSGEYEPVPTVGGYTLPVRDMHMTKDITIKPIPTYSVQNGKGGITFVIGG